MSVRAPRSAGRAQRVLSAEQGPQSVRYAPGGQVRQLPATARSSSSSKPLFLHRRPAPDTPSPRHSSTTPSPIPAASRWPLAPTKAQSVIRAFEDLHAEHERNGPEVTVLRRELALVPSSCPPAGKAGPIRHRRRRSRVEAAYSLVGLRSRVEVLVAMEGWDGDSAYESQSDATTTLWSWHQQRRKLERRVEHLETSEQSLQEEINKLRVHKDSFEVEKSKLAVLQQALEIETTQLAESQQALASQHSLLQERLTTVSRLKKTLESAHAQLRRNYEYAKCHSEKIVKNLRSRDREKLRAQFEKKRGLNECKAQVNAMKTTLTALEKATEAKKENIDALKSELTNVPPLELSPTKRQSVLNSVRETFQAVTKSRSTHQQVEIVSEVALTKSLLDAQMKREHAYDMKFAQIRNELGTSRANASSGVSSARKELDRWRNTVASAQKTATRKKSRPTLSALQSLFA